MKNLEDNKLSEELNQIFENAAVVLILVNIEGTIIHINKTGIQMLNKNKNDVLGHLAGEALDCINSYYEEQIVCGKGKDCCNCPLRNTFSDTFNSGKSHYQNQGDLDVNVNGEIVRLNLLVSTSIIKANDEKYVLITIDDITKEKQYQNEIKDTLIKYKKAHKELKDSEKQLRELNATKNIFFSIIAHDLRNPFNAINGFAEILLENHNSYSDQEKELYLKIIAESSQNAQELLENLLEWSKIQIGIISFNPKSQNIDNIINTAINQTKLFAIKKNIKVDNLLHDPIIASVDNLIINTMLRNLLTNAIKFTPQYGNVSINAIIEKSELIISVQDTGVGISKKNLHKLFKISEKCSSLGTEQEKGSGLGLIVCNELIKIHVGKIWVESEEGKGSCFSFSIPIQNY